MKKKNSKKTSVSSELAIFIICTFIILCTMYVLFSLDKEFQSNAITSDTSIVKTENYDIESATKLIDRLEYPKQLAYGNDIFNSRTFYYKHNLNAKDLSDEARLFIALNNSIDNLNCTNGICVIEENELIDNYYKIFDIEYKFVSNKYISKNKNNLITYDTNFKSSTNGVVFKKVVNAEIQDDSKLLVYVKVAFQYNSTLFYNYDLTDIIEELSTCTSDDDLDNYEDLNQYVFEFKIDKNNNYIFQGVKRK